MLIVISPEATDGLVNFALNVLEPWRLLRIAAVQALAFLF